MPGKIFISCGQVTSAERTLSKQVAISLTNKGFNPYVASEAQSIQDINTEIIGKLKKSDYYIYIDLKRECIAGYFWCRKYRGSLFTNQELAIVYALGFERTIFLQQKGILLEGMARYILSNAKKFTNVNEVIPIVEDEIDKRKWDTKYSRHLSVQYIQAYPKIPYGDHTQSMVQQIYHVGIRNCTKDIAAINVIAHLVAITEPNGNINVAIDKGDLKWARQIGYTRNIPPGEIAPFDAFALDEQNPQNVYLHSSSDAHPRIPIINQSRSYILHYQIYSENFPLLEFKIRLLLAGQTQTTIAELIE